MKVVVQRVSEAAVRVDKTVVGNIQKGYLLLVGIAEGDTTASGVYLARKIVQARLFEDSHGKLNQNILQVDGALLSVSQFTLLAETQKGNRPSFTKAAAPEVARKLYEDFNSALRSYGVEVAEGQFGADMQVSLINDGPVTLLYEKEA